MSSSREPSIITLVKPGWIERQAHRRAGAVVLVQADGDVRPRLDRGFDHVAQEGFAGVFAGAAAAWRITGLSHSCAASMIARICSMLLMLKAGTP